MTKAKLFVEGINFDFSKFAISIFPVVSLPVNFCLWNKKAVPLFVFTINGLEQNARQLLAPTSYSVFHSLSHGSLHFGLNGS